jgi:uncharacterized membrane protein
MKGLTLSFGLALLVCLPASALAQITYTFRTITYPGDTFTQTLGINNGDEIAGYHGNGTTGHPFSGFTLVLPSTFTTENFPGAAQTQVIGINDFGETDGFYISGNGNNHGFVRNFRGDFMRVDFPGTTSTSPKINQLLGLNEEFQQAGYYADAAGNDHGYIFARHGAVYSVLTIPGGVSVQATGINGAGQVSGFYVDKMGTNHGFLLNLGTFTTLDFPESTFTQALGLNNDGQVVGTYIDMSGLVHGFAWSEAAGFQSIDDPSGVGATIINGINDLGVIVGFFGTCTTGGTTCDGFVGTP